MRSETMGVTLLWHMFFLLLSSTIASALDSPESYNFAIMPKSIGNSFFFPVREGCQKRAGEYTGNEDTPSVTCEWVGPVDEDPTGEAQAKVLEDIIEAHVNGTHPTHGIAISVMNGPSLVEPIQKALDAGMSVICFDSDSNESERQAYVGTDNHAFGVQLAKVLQQLRPTGGELAMLTIPGPNLDARVQGLRDEIKENGAWRELPSSLTYQEGTLEDAMDQMARLKKDYPNLKAIVPTYGGPMNEASTWTTFVQSHPDMTFVVADAMPHQVQLMEQGFADGLVGQLPYQSGEQCIDTLFNLQQSGNPPRDRKSDMVFGTNLSFLLRIPLVLPALTVDRNELGYLVIFGYFLLACLLAIDLGLMAWVVKNRASRIVAAGQPIFLLTILGGIFMLSWAILPLSIADDQTFSQSQLNAACMAVPWLVALGFGMVFSALFSKLWRVYRLIQSSLRFSKVQIQAKDVLWPFLGLTLLNCGILTAWTIAAPLKYTREWHDGSDPWNRPISSYGSCSSENSIPYLTPLILLNFGALLVANFQAFRVRNMKSILSESKYIAITVASMTQAFLVGLPVLFLVEEEPKAQYVVSVLLIFCVGMAVLGFIFFPKVMAANGKTPEQSDARNSHFGASLRAGINGSKPRSNQETTTSSVNDTVAQIRLAASIAASVAFDVEEAATAQPGAGIEINTTGDDQLETTPAPTRAETKQMQDEETGKSR